MNKYRRLLLIAALTLCSVLGFTSLQASYYLYPYASDYYYPKHIVKKLKYQNYKFAQKIKPKNKTLQKLSAHSSQDVQLGNRPLFLVKDMDDSSLKDALMKCENGPFHKTDFSIGHRGAPLQYPEHTRESYEAAARMGAGIVECDVTFTQDRELVCRHSQCDLHTTTNILVTPLAAKCSEAFTPADPLRGTLASAKCCTSDISLAEFKTLKGKMDVANSKAISVAEYIDGTPSLRTDLYASRGTLLSHAESIKLFKNLNVKFTPELKSAAIAMPYEGDYTQEMYAQQMLDEYITANVPPENVWAQSFNLNDLGYWISDNPQFGKQAVYLDNRVYEDENFVASLRDFESLANSGVQIIAPPTFALVKEGADGKIVPSDYALLAKQAGLGIITWTVERSGQLANGGGFYYSSIANITENDGDVFNLIDVLAKDVGVIGIFSDWPATTSYYANCMNLE